MRELIEFFGCIFALRNSFRRQRIALTVRTQR
jgi:hypothetical protein